MYIHILKFIDIDVHICMDRQGTHTLRRCEGARRQAQTCPGQGSTKRKQSNEAQPSFGHKTVPAFTWLFTLTCALRKSRHADLSVSLAACEFVGCYLALTNYLHHVNLLVGTWIWSIDTYAAALTLSNFLIFEAMFKKGDLANCKPREGPEVSYEEYKAYLKQEKKRLKKRRNSRSRKLLVPATLRRSRCGRTLKTRPRAGFTGTCSTKGLAPPAMGFEP